MKDTSGEASPTRVASPPRSWANVHCPVCDACYGAENMIDAELQMARHVEKDHPGCCSSCGADRRALEAENAFEKSEKQRLAKLLSDTYERAGKAETELAKEREWHTTYGGWKARAEKAEARVREPEVDYWFECSKCGKTPPCEHLPLVIHAKLREARVAELERNECNCAHGPWYDIHGKRTAPPAKGAKP